MRSFVGGMQKTPSLTLTHPVALLNFSLMTPLLSVSFFGFPMEEAKSGYSPVTPYSQNTKNFPCQNTSHAPRLTGTEHQGKAWATKHQNIFPVYPKAPHC